MILVIGLDAVELMFPHQLLDEGCSEGLPRHGGPWMGQYGHSPGHVHQVDGTAHLDGIPGDVGWLSRRQE